MRRIGLLAGAVLLLDLVTKGWVRSEIPLHGEPVRLIGDWLRLIHVRNAGSAFGLFQGGRYFFIGFSLFAIVLILILARSRRHRTAPFGLSFGLILGGAFGNLVDRLSSGAVTDFLDMGIGMLRWPTFNVADIGISVGVTLLAILLLFDRPPAAEASEPPL